jgi:predicted GIY-YIG superfamily endonuclease
MTRDYYVYILPSKSRELYIGVTNTSPDEWPSTAQALTPTITPTDTRSYVWFSSSGRPTVAMRSNARSSSRDGDGCGKSS